MPPNPFEKERFSLTLIRLRTRILLGLEHVLVDKHLVILPHHLPLQDLSVFQETLELFNDEYRLCRDTGIADQGDDRVRVSDQLEEDRLDGRVVAAPTQSSDAYIRNSGSGGHGWLT